MLNTDNAIASLCAAAEEQRVAGDLDRAADCSARRGRRPPPLGSAPSPRITSPASSRCPPGVTTGTALDEARLAAEDSEAVLDLWPSLHLAFAASLEAVGSPDRAAESYRDALDAAVALGSAGEGYVRAAEEGIRRVGAEGA